MSIQSISKQGKEINQEFNSCFLGMLPKDITLDILSYLNPQGLGRCAQVCSQLKKLFSDDKLWIKFIKDSDVNIPDGKNVKEYINENSTKSLEEVVEHIEKFINYTFADAGGI